MDIKRNVLFFPDKEAGKDDAKLRLRIRWAGKEVLNFNVGYRVELTKWVTDAQRCKAGTSHGKKKITAFEINKEIDRLAVLIDSIFRAFEAQNATPTKNEFKARFLEHEGKDHTKIKGVGFYSLFDEFTATVGESNQWTKATHTKFGSIKKHLQDYNPKLDLNKLTEDDLQGFISYLHALEMRNTTIQKTVAFVRWFLRWANNKGYYKGTLHTAWRPKFKGTDGNQKEVIHLTWEELMHLSKLELPEPKQYLARVRDVFCFCCFTSLRYSDVAKLKRSDIKDGYISVVTQKTVDGLRIELNNHSKAILDKYADTPFKDNKALPVISNVKMNEYLKELGAIAGIDEPQRIVYFKGNQRIEEVHPKYELLTTHCGRRTFIVNALYLGIPAEVVMRWTGHNDYKAMKPYVKIVDTLKEREMNKFNRE